MSSYEEAAEFLRGIGWVVPSGNELGPVLTESDIINIAREKGWEG